MPTVLFSETTRERLKAYFPFSKTTLNAVGKLADKQQSFPSYKTFFASAGLSTAKLHVTKQGRGVSVIDIHPNGAKQTLVLHLPMGNPLDANQQYQLASLATLLPKTRIVGFGNPSGGAYSFKEQGASFWRLFLIAMGIRPQLLITPELDYLATKNIKDAYQIGYSYGALKALLTSRYAPAGTVKGVVTIELVSHPRNPIRLLKDFQNTFPPLGEYVKASGLRLFQDARNDAVTGHDYHAGMRRAINLAIGIMLSRVNALKLANQVLSVHNKASLVMAWGTASELVDDNRMRRALTRMNDLFAGRVKAVRLPGQKHGFANDVHLHAAIIYEAIRSRAHEA